MNTHVVYTFRKSESEEIWFSLREYKGRHYLDVRLFFAENGGEFRPTKKGISLAVDHFGQFVNGIEKLSEVLSVKGGAA